MKRLTTAGACQDIGRRVGEVRAERGLTQEAWAERLGKNPRWVQSVEGGKENVTVETLVRLANVLKVPLFEFFTPPTQPKRGPGRPPRSS